MSQNSGIEVERPLAHRPGVLVVKRDGTRHILSDGAPFTAQELITLRILAEPANSEPASTVMSETSDRFVNQGGGM